MSEVWPSDVLNRKRRAAVDRLRPFKCVLLTPFDSRFECISEQINQCVKNVYETLPKFPGESEYPYVNRLDWISSSGVVQNEIWDEIVGADLIFCDITGCNPNVLFESGVAAAIKRTSQVVFIRDQFFRQQAPFDLAPLRYTEYAMTSDGLEIFREKMKTIILNAFMAFPDDQIDSPLIAFPARIDFAGSHDDLRVYTPPLAHRRVLNSALEFGSIHFFSNSWASLGNARVLNFDLKFDMAFRNPVDEDAWIGVGFRSQHFYANYAHILYLRRDGKIILAEPNETSDHMHENRTLRASTSIDDEGLHHFHVRFSSTELFISIDDFSTTMNVADMPKVLGPGLIRFQSFRAWASITAIQASDI